MPDALDSGRFALSFRWIVRRVDTMPRRADTTCCGRFAIVFCVAAGWTVACVLPLGAPMRTPGCRRLAFLASVLASPLLVAHPALAQSPSPDVRTYAVIGHSQVKLGSGVQVTSGNVAASDPSALLTVGKGASCPVIAEAVGDRARLLPNAVVGRLFSNDAVVRGDARAAAGGPFAVSLPLVLALPTSPSVTPGAQDITVDPGASMLLAPGSYRKITVGTGGRLTLRGLTGGSGAGQYQVESVKVGFEGALLADNPAVVNVAGRVSLTSRCRVGASPDNPRIAGDFQINVLGPAAKVSRSAVLNAYLRVPSGKLGVGSGAAVHGQLIAERVTIAKRAVIERAGVCGDGAFSAGEQCDASAPGGDVACPGDCIAGDPGKLGRIENGQPGQCRCRCTSNADCDDRNVCDGIETCQAGVCVPGTALACDDGNSCTRDCDPLQGCVNTPLPDGTGCDDADLCTQNDRCQGGTCRGAPRNCNDGNPCTTDTCEPSTGCVRTPVASGAPCNDQNACTVGDACLRGACVGASAVTCPSSGPCTVGSCDPTRGCILLNAIDGTPCGPNGLVCVSGVCR